MIFSWSLWKIKNCCNKNNIFNSNEDDVDFRERSLVKLRAIEEFLSSIQAVADDKQIQAKKWKIL